MARSRVEYLDIAKGIGILGVIIGHHLLAIGMANPYPWLVDWYWSFHMPMFFLISGYFMKDEAISIVFTKGVKNLLIPFYFTCFCGAITVVSSLYLVNGHYEGPKLLDWLWGILCFDREYEQMGMWFLPALFFGKFMYSLLSIYYKEFRGFFSLLLFLVVQILITFPGIINNGITRIFMLALSSLIFIHCGVLCKLNSFFDYKMRKEHWLILLFVLVCAYKVPLDMSAYNYPLNIFNIFTSILISVSIIYFCKLIENYRTLRPLQKYLSFCGRHSLFFLCLHAFFYTIQLHRHIPLNQPFLIGCIITILISIVVSVYVVVLNIDVNLKRL